MLKGAHRAAARTAPFPSIRIWVVAVPVVAALVLERIAALLITATWLVGRESSNHVLLVLPTGGLTLRTTTILILTGFTVYAGLWTVLSWAETRSRRTRIEALGPALATTLLVLISGFLTIQAFATPSAKELLDSAESDVEHGSPWLLERLVANDVPGVEEACHRMFASHDEYVRFCAAAGLWVRGDRSAETVGVLDEIFNRPPEEMADERWVRVGSLLLVWAPEYPGREWEEIREWWFRQRSTPDRPR